MADKKGLPEILSKGISTDISRRNFGRGLTGVATQIATGPLLDSGISAVKNLSKGSSILKKIPMTKELIKQYYKIESLKDKLLDNLSNEEKNLGGLTENTSYGTVNDQYEYIVQLTEHKNRLTRYSNITDPDKLPITYIQRVNKQGNKVTDFRAPGEDYVIEKDRIKKELEDVTERLKNTLDMLEDDKNKIQKKAILELLKLDNEQNEIRTIASNKKLPFNFALEQVAKEEYDYVDDVAFGSGQLSEDPNSISNAEVLNNAREEYLIDDAFENTKKFEDLENKYNIINSIEEKERIKQAILSNTLDKSSTSLQTVFQRNLQEIMQDPDLPADFKERAAEQGAEIHLRSEIKKTRSLLESNTHTVYDKGLSGHNIFTGEKEIDPTYTKDILNTVKKEIFSAAGKVVKDQSINAGKKILNKIIEKVQEPSKQNTKVTPKKTLSIEKLPGKGKIIDVESTKTEIKEPVKPKRNLAQDLVGGIGKRLKYSPIGAALYTTEVGDAELPLETSPRGYGVRRENKGRSSKDPNKNYNRQRFI